MMIVWSHELLCHWFVHECNENPLFVHKFYVHKILQVNGLSTFIQMIMIMKCIMIRPVLYDLVYSVYIHYVCHHWLQYMKYILVTFSATILVVWKHQQHIFLEQCQSLWCHSCLPQKFVKNYEMPIVKFVIWNMVRVFLIVLLAITISW